MLHREAEPAPCQMDGAPPAATVHKPNGSTAESWTETVVSTGRGPRQFACSHSVDILVLQSAAPKVWPLSLEHPLKAHGALIILLVDDPQ